jgi:uncharacterized membrane protein
MEFLLKIKAWQLFSLLLIPILGASILDFNQFEPSILSMCFCLVYVLAIAEWNFRVVMVFNRTEGIFTENQQKKIIWTYRLLLVSTLCCAVGFSLNEQLFTLASLINIVCLILLVYNCSKILRHLEKKESNDVAGIVGEMIAILYFPIGIWWLQSKINKLYNEKIG